MSRSLVEGGWFSTHKKSDTYTLMGVDGNPFTARDGRVDEETKPTGSYPTTPLSYSRNGHSRYGLGNALVERAQSRSRLEGTSTQIKGCHEATAVQHKMGKDAGIVYHRYWSNLLRWKIPP